MKRHAEKNDRQFWLWSALVHVILFALVLLSPAGQIFMTREHKLKPEIIRKGEELNEVVEDIRDLAVQRLKEQVVLLEAGQERMGTNFDTLNKHYQQFAGQQKEGARDRFTDEMLTVQSRIDGLLRALEGAQKDPVGGLDGMRNAINENMARLLASQDEIRRSLQLMAPEREDLLAMQAETMDLQQEANKFFRWSMHEAGVCERYRKTLESTEKSIPATKTKLDGFSAEVKRLGEEINKAKKAQQDASNAERNAINLMKKLDGEIRKTKDSLGKREKALADLKKAEQQDDTKIAAAQKAVDDTKATLTKQQADRKTAEQTRNDQRTAKDEAAKRERSLRGEHGKAQRSERDTKRTYDNLVRSRTDAEKSAPDHKSKRDYCVRKSMELQKSVLDKLNSISEQFLAMLDGNGPTAAPAPDPEAPAGETATAE